LNTTPWKLLPKPGLGTVAIVAKSGKKEEVEE
jgi:hypothetical protein